MADKIFTNVRLGLKVDTLENWGKSSLVLKRGELAFATIAASAGLGLSEPVTMVKIGDGEHTFSELEYNFYAKASDVLAACKSEASLKAFINSVITDAGVATDDALKTLSTQVSTNKTNIEALQADLNTAETGLKAKMAAAEADIEAIEGRFGADTVALEISAAINALNLANTYAAKTHGHAIADVEGLSDSIAAAKKAGTDANAALEAYKTLTNGAVKDNSDAIGALETLVGETAVAEQIENALKVEVEGAKVEKYALATALAAEVETARAAEKANADAIEVLNGNAETAGSVDYKVAQAVAAIMENPDETMNSINELVTWVNDHAEDALEMSNQVAANKTALETLNGDATKAGSVDKKIADAIAAENLSQYATDGELSALAGRVTTIETEHNTESTGLKARLTQAEADIDALETKVGDKTVAEQISSVTNPLAERVVALEAIDHDHANKAELDKFVDGDKAKLDTAVQTITAGVGLKAVKTGTDVAIDLDETVTFIFDCGTSAV